LEKNKFKDE
jgi:DNA repair exonuclease SbcCD ATPase subunit